MKEEIMIKEIEEKSTIIKKYRILEFFSEDNNILSSMRLVFLMFGIAVVLVWSYVSILSKTMSDIPAGVQTTCLILIAGKGYQKLIENGSDGTSVLEKLIKK
jgi:hypothetical protein